jgi:hypothetical protein
MGRLDAVDCDRGPPARGGGISPGAASHFLGQLGILNKRSTNPAGYGERFVKRRGLFSASVTSHHLSFRGCVSR